MLDEAAPKGYKGYCIDMFNEIAELGKFDYEIVSQETTFGDIAYGENGDKWDGVVKKLIDNEADVGLGSMPVSAERETVVDFTIPYYNLVGITILMKQHTQPDKLFKFLQVLEPNVWLCILAAYFFTSFLMWFFDKFSPYSYQVGKLLGC